MECSLEACTMNYSEPDRFYKFVCQNRMNLGLFRFFTGVRFLLLLYNYIIDIWVLCVIFLEPELKIYIWFHTWMQALWTSAAEMAFGGFLAVRGDRDFDNDQNFSVSMFFKMYWALFSAALPSAILSFISYWCQVFDGKVVPMFIVMSNVTPFLILCEFAMVSFPLRILHFYCFAIFYSLYIIFTVIYSTAGGTGLKDEGPIYHFLNWKSPGTGVLTAFIGFVIGEATYIIFCFLSLWKLKSKNRQ